MVRSAALVKPVADSLSSEYLALAMWSPCPIPLPPLTEQHRIVCDQLEAQLATAQTESRRFLETVLHEARVPVAEEHQGADRLHAEAATMGQAATWPIPAIVTLSVTHGR